MASSDSWRNLLAVTAAAGAIAFINYWPHYLDSKSNNIDHERNSSVESITISEEGSDLPIASNLGDIPLTEIVENPFIENKDIPSNPNKKAKIYTSIGEPVVSKTLFKETHKTSYLIEGYETFPSGLSEENFYEEISRRDKMIKIETLLTVPKGLANSFNDGSVHMLGYKIRDGFINFSRALEENDGYTKIDTSNLENMLNRDGILLEEYPNGSEIYLSTEGYVINRVAKDRGWDKTDFETVRINFEDTNEIDSLKKFCNERIRENYYKKWHIQYVEQNSSFAEK